MLECAVARGPRSLFRRNAPFFDVRRKAWFVSSDRTPPARLRPVVSLFTGCGGMELGLEAAGFRTAVCVEIDGNCNRTLEANRPAWRRMEPGDITKLSTNDILAAAGLEPGRVGLVTAGCPCQPFSTMGKEEGVSCDDGNLFAHFIRIVREAGPAGFVFENVAGILKHEGVIRTIAGMADDLGYRMAARVLNAADYGVPQCRNRLIVLGLRGRSREAPAPAFPWPTHAEDPAGSAAWYAARGLAVPEPSPWATVRGCFAAIDYEEVGRMEARGECHSMSVSPLMAERIRHIRPGTRDNFKALPEALRPPCWRSGPDGAPRYQANDTFGRLDPGRPSVTIRTCGYHPMKGRYLHPTLDRGLNTVEMARLQGFPPEWRFVGNMTSVSRQIGNAVPPPLAEAIGRAMAAQLAAARPLPLEESAAPLA